MLQIWPLHGIVLSYSQEQLVLCKEGLAFCEQKCLKTKIKSGSHVTIRLVNQYPNYMVIGFDSMEYCASKKNLDTVEGKPNFKFMEVRGPKDG